MEITATDDIEKIMKRNEDSLRNLWDVKCIDICAMGVPEGEKEEKEKGAEKILEEVTAENSTWERISSTKSRRYRESQEG